MPGRSAIARQVLAAVCLAGLGAQTFLPLVHATLWHPPGHALIERCGEHPGAAGGRWLPAVPFPSSPHRIEAECPFCWTTVSSRDKFGAPSAAPLVVSLVETSSPYRLLFLTAPEVRSGPHLSDAAPRAPPA